MSPFHLKETQEILIYHQSDVFMRFNPGSNGITSIFVHEGQISIQSSSGELMFSGMPFIVRPTGNVDAWGMERNWYKHNFLTE